MPKDKLSGNSPASNGAGEQKRCRFSNESGRCVNPAIRVMWWDNWRKSEFCDFHWEIREEMRPASASYVSTALAGAMQIATRQTTLEKVMVELKAIKKREAR